MNSKLLSEIDNPEVLLAAGAKELAGATVATEHEAIWKELGGEEPVPVINQAEVIRANLRASCKHEAFKVLVLGLCAGLRRGEIDSLLWSQVNLKESHIVVKATDCFSPKSNSIRKVPIDAEFVRLLKQWNTKSTGRFVVEGVVPKIESDSHHHRAGRAHAELIQWLHAKGLTARTPLHSLRMEFGSVVCQKACVYGASRLLRRANIAIS